MDTTGIPTRFHKKKVSHQFKKSRFAASQAAKLASVNPERAGYIEKDCEDEEITQDIIRQNVDLGSASKQFDLKSKSGPYSLDYSRNGRFLALCGKRGHIAAFDWLSKKLLFETNVNEECRDIKFLHQETMVAVAQKNYTYIYDNQGIEMHCLKRLAGIRRLEFLPYHFLLVALADNGFLYYLDASVGEIVASYPTHRGSLNVACQNPSNASILTGHTTGCVSVWIPTEKNPVIKMLCHNSGVKSIAVNRTGQYLATCGLDRYLKIWDLRSTQECLSNIVLPTPSITMGYSQTGILALGSSTTVQILKDPFSLGESTVNDLSEIAPGVHRRVFRKAYLTHDLLRPVHCVSFAPFEDVLGVGTAGGFSSLLCPGAGEPNFDALEDNPFASVRYRQEREVRRLLDKIPYTMISVDTMLNKVRREDIVDEWEKKKTALMGEIPAVPMPKVNRNKKKGRSKAGKVEKRKRVTRFNRKMFEVSNLMRAKIEKASKLKPIEKMQEEGKGNLPSDALVVKQRSKKLTKSALDVLIPRKPPNPL
nr:hypothetical transcript [Hymenolepis microstoma]